MPPVLTAYTQDDIPAQETWLDCATADGGRLRVVLLAADPQATAATPKIPRRRSSNTACHRTWSSRPTAVTCCTWCRAPRPGGPQGVEAPTAACASDQNWTRGILQAEEAPLARVVAELARYRRGYLGCAADMAPSQRDHAMKLANALLTGGVSEGTLRRADGL